jgi:hypothetical protein
MRLRSVFILSGILLVFISISGGCATTPKIKDPPTPESGLLVGRIKLTCTDFPGSWGVNGDHTGGIEIYFRNVSTKEIISVKSSGEDGFFYILHPPEGGLILYDMKFVKKSARQTTTLPYRFEEVIGLGIKPSSVNNVGDIHWSNHAETRESKEYSQKGSHATLHAESSHEFRFNYKEVENWFKKTFPDSAWNDKNWVSVAPLSWDSDNQQWVPLETQ